MTPPGFQMIALPFSDDIRTPEADPGFVGDQHVFADDAQVRLWLPSTTETRHPSPPSPVPHGSMHGSACVLDVNLLWT